MVDLKLGVDLLLKNLPRFRGGVRAVEGDLRRLGAAGRTYGGQQRDARGRFVGGGGYIQNYGPDVYRDAAGRLRDSRGRFVAEGGGGSGGRGGKDLGKRIRDLGSDVQSVGTKMAVAGGAAAYGLKRLIQPVEDYERAIVDTISVTGDAANNLVNEKKLRALSESFVDMGVNATDTARAMEFLALAGYDTQQQASAIPNVLFAARAGSEDVIKTAGYLSDVATGFGFGADKFQRVSDVMTYINNETATTLSATAEAMKEIGPYAQIAGLDFEKMAAGVGVLANAGFRGRQAGTALRNMLLSFTKMSDPARAELKKLGLAQKDFIALIDKGDLQGAILKLDQAVEKKGYGAGGKMRVMNTIFQRFTSAKEMALALQAVRDGKWDELTAGAKGSQGSAEKVARRKLDSDAGKLDIARARLEQLQVKLGQKILPALLPVGEELVASLEKLSKWVEQNPDTAKFIAKTAAELSLLGIVGGPAVTVLGSFVKVFGKFSSMAGLGRVASNAASAGEAIASAGAAGSNAAGKVGLLSRALGSAGLVAAVGSASWAIGTFIDQQLRISDQATGKGSTRDTSVGEHKGTGNRLALFRGAGFLTKEEQDQVKIEDTRLKLLRKRRDLLSGKEMGLEEVVMGKKVLTRGSHGALAGVSAKEVRAVEEEIKAAERRRESIVMGSRLRDEKYRAKREMLLPMFEARAVELREMREGLKEKAVSASVLRGRKGKRARAEVQRAQQEYLRQEMITQSRAQSTGLLKGGEGWREKLQVDISVTDGRVDVKAKSGNREVNGNAGAFTLGM